MSLIGSCFLPVAIHEGHYRVADLSTLPQDLRATEAQRLRWSFNLTVDLAHSARADGGDDFIRPETSAGTKRHSVVSGGF